MGTTKYIIRVKFPNGEVASGAQIEGINRDAWATSARFWNGTTQDDGSYTWEHIDTGVNGDKYDFYCRYLDANGIEWKGEASDRLFASQMALIKEITLRQPFLDETLDFSLPTDIEDSISKVEFGGELVASVKEMSFALKKGMAHSALTLSTYITEGFLRARAERLGKWKSDYERLTFGQLIENREIQELLPIGILDKMKALNQLRKPSAHFKGLSSAVEEAHIGAQIVTTLASDWFKPSTPQTTIGSPESSKPAGYGE